MQGQPLHQGVPTEPPLIWLLGGTADGPPLAAALLQRGWRVRLSVVSAAATRVYAPHPQLQLRVGDLADDTAVERELEQHRPRWVVDATGQQRALLGDPAPERHPLVSGVGVEWLLQLDLPRWRRWAEQLSFMLGSDWVPQGYGWVFPMGPGVLKLGVCRLLDEGHPQPPLQGLMQQLQQRLGLQGATVLDRHGGLVRSSIRRREPHQRGPVLGLGDAVSTANLLGGEGIRHALSSSAVLAPLLLRALQGDHAGLRHYPAMLRRELGWRWSLSGRLAQRTWLGLRNAAADQRLGRLLGGLERCSAEDLSALLFDYRFERYGLRALPYALGWR